MNSIQSAPRHMILWVAVLCLLVAACEDSPDDRLAACQAAGVTDADALERCKQSVSEKEAVIAAFNEASEAIERKKAAEDALKREAELKRKEEEDMAQREQECERLIREFTSVTPVGAEAGVNSTEQFELAVMERDEGYFGKCIDYAIYAINLAKGQ